MSVLYSLVSDVIFDVLSEWIDLKPLVRLDSATCHSKWRCDLHWILSNDIFEVKLTDSQYKVDCLNWIFSRGICLRKLIARDRMFALNQLQCSINFENINEAIFDNISLSQAKKLFECCSNINSIILRTSNPFVLCELSPASAQKVVSIVVRQIMIQSVEVCTFIAENCSNLIKLELMNIISETSQNAIERIIQHNPSLTYISLSTDVKLLSVISVSCCKVSFVKLDCTQLYDSILANFVRTCSALDHLECNFIRPLSYLEYNRKKSEIILRSNNVSLCESMKSFPKLTSIHITNVVAQDAVTMEAICSHGESLRKFFLTTESISVVVMSSLFKLKHIVHLRLEVRLLTITDFLTAIQTCDEYSAASMNIYVHHNDFDAFKELFSFIFYQHSQFVTRTDYLKAKQTFKNLLSVTVGAYGNPDYDVYYTRK